MEQTEPPEDAITLRYAETDQDVVGIHQFLLIVAQPAMRAPVDPIESLQEIIRVTKDEVAIMAIRGGHLIGTLGVIRCSWWYNPARFFMADRWNFVLPQFRNLGVGDMLEDEAEVIADAAELEFINQGKIREKRRGGKRPKLMLMPRSSGVESASAGNHENVHEV